MYVCVCVHVLLYGSVYLSLLVKTHPPPHTQVLDVSQVQKNYPSYEMKRKLRDSYAVFLADDRVLPILSKPLGKAFYKTKK